MNKHWIFLLIIMIMTLSLCGCKGKNDSTVSTTYAVEEETQVSGEYSVTLKGVTISIPRQYGVFVDKGNYIFIDEDARGWSATLTVNNSSYNDLVTGCQSVYDKLETAGMNVSTKLTLFCVDDSNYAYICYKKPNEDTTFSMLLYTGITDDKRFSLDVSMSGDTNPEDVIKKLHESLKTAVVSENEDTDSAGLFAQKEDILKDKMSDFIMNFNDKEYTFHPADLFYNTISYDEDDKKTAVFLNEISGVNVYVSVTSTDLYADTAEVINDFLSRYQGSEDTVSISDVNQHTIDNHVYEWVLISSENSHNELFAVTKEEDSFICLDAEGSTDRTFEIKDFDAFLDYSCK